MHPILNAWIAAGKNRKIMLMRHGHIHTGGNKKWFIGQTNLPLTDAGLSQARYWQTCMADIHLAGIVCSDLQRCMQTARIIADQRTLDIRPMPALREIHLGRWENLAFDRVRTHWPDAFEQRGREMARFRPPDGESFADLQQRAVPAFEAIVSASAGPVLIVAHAGVNRVILAHLMGLPLKNIFCLAQAPGALNLIDRQAGGYRLHLLNLPPTDRQTCV